MEQPNVGQCAMRLMGIIEFICGSSAGIDYVPQMTASALFDLLQIDGSKMSLQKYVKLFDEKYAACTRMGFIFGTPEVQADARRRFRDHYGFLSSEFTELNNNIVRRAEEMVVTQIFFQRCGNKYEELRRQFKNDYRLHNWNDFPINITKMGAVLENWQPMSDVVNAAVQKEL